MSKDDSKWLENALKDYTFNDVDRLKEVCTEMKKDVEGGFKILSNEKAYEILLDLEEIIEIHERNALNLSVMGGLHNLI